MALFAPIALYAPAHIATSIILFSQFHDWYACRIAPIFSLRAVAKCWLLKSTLHSLVCELCSLSFRVYASVSLMCGLPCWLVLSGRVPIDPKLTQELEEGKALLQLSASATHAAFDALIAPLLSLPSKQVM